MYKKTLLSLAVASTVGLTGCFSDGGSKNAGASTAPPTTLAEQGTYPVFNPVTSELPLPNDLIFDSEAGDGSFSVDIGPADEGNPVLEALNKLSGASTVAPAVIKFNGQIDASTVDSQAFLPPSDPRNPTSGPIPNPTQNVFLIELQYASGAPVRAFSAQEPPTAPTAITAQVALGAEGAPPQDLSGRNQMEAAGALADLAQNRRYDHDVVELDGTSAIRIRPNQPLDPLKRYLVVVTDEVKDVNGDPINSSPTYTRLSDDDAGDIGNAGLDTVRGLINGLWESVATSYFGVTNASRESAPSLDALSEDNIALTYTFTTSEDEKVLSHIANPANWIADQVERATKRSAADAAMENGATDFSGVSSAVRTAVANFKPSEELDPALTPCDSDADSDPSNGFQTNLGQGQVTLSDQFQCIGVALEGSLSSAGFPTPSARDFSFGTTTDAVALSSVLSQVVSQGDINVHQGSITLPYYLGVPDSSSGAPIKTSSWQPDSGLAAAIADATGFAIPQADPSTSEVLNYNFPFPEKQADLQVPMVTITSSDVGTAELNDGNNNYPVVIYQHGITTDRSAALAFGSKLVNSYDAATGGEELVVIAIDQPLHGVDPASNEERLTLAGSLFASIEESNDMVPEGSLNTEANRQLAVDGDAQALADNNQALDLASAKGIVGTVSRAGSTIPGLAPTFTDSGVNDSGVTERHFGYTANEASQPVEMNFDASAALGTSGSLFINLSNFLNGRDNLRQGSVDLMNLRATIENMAGLDGNSTYFVGHSLGTQTGGTFAGAVKQSNAEIDPLLQELSLAGVHLQTPVAGVVRLLENSPSFAPTVVGGLQAAAGISQGDSSYETYLNVNQAALDSADPINFAPQLADSNTLISQVNGDRTTPNAADTRFSDMIEGVPGYDGGPLNVTFPNGLTVDSFEAPLTGSEALAKLMRLSAGEAEINTGTSGQATPAITRYLAGTHGVPVLPQAESVDAGGVLKDRTIAQSETEVVSSQNAQLVFGELVSQTLQMVQGAPNITGGNAAMGAGSNVIQKD